MKQAHGWTSIAAIAFAAALLAGCGKEEAPTVSSTPAPSASDTRKEDERAIAARLAEQNADLAKKDAVEAEASDRQRYAQTVRDVASRWTEVGQAASSTGRGGMGPLIAKMDAIIGDMRAINNTNECTAKARDAYVGAMSTIRDGIQQFAQEAGEQSEGSKKKIGDGAIQFSDAERLIGGC